jgi:hypothetical protein
VVILRGVQVPGHVVHSDGFRATTGDLITVALGFACLRREAAAADEPSRVTSEEGRDCELVGVSQSFATTIFADGWLVEAAGILLYAQDLGPAADLPPPGTRVRAQGSLAVAEAYESAGFEPAADLLARAEQQWLVQRIVRRSGPARRVVEAIDSFRTGSDDFLLDLAGSGHAR